MLQRLSQTAHRECARNLRLFVRRQSSPLHFLSAHASTSPVQFATFFNRNDRYSVTAAPKHVKRLSVAPVSVVVDHDWQNQPEASKITNADPDPPPAGYKRIHPLTLKQLTGVYAQLSKARLTTLITLTAMASVAISPVSTTVPVLLATACGTALCSASANTLNQLQEVPFDAQMARTRNRPLVRRVISPLHATAFAAVTGVAGPLILWTCVNPTTAILGAANIVLYAGVYTYLKRRSIVNTWVGAVVGGLPPLMGWTACNSHLIPSVSYSVHYFLPPFLLSPDSTPLPVELADNPLAPLALFMLLFSWQFPHFNSLSHLVRSSYGQAGYRMLSVTNPQLNALVSLRHTLLLIPVCSILFPLSGLTTWAFALTSLIPNAIWVRYAWAFWRTGAEREARKVWYTSLWWLPVVMGLMMVHKNGLQWTKWFGEEKERSENVVNGDGLKSS